MKKGPFRNNRSIGIPRSGKARRQAIIDINNDKESMNMINNSNERELFEYNLTLQLTS